MRNAARLGEKRGEHAKLGFGETKRSNLLLEHGRHLTRHMYQQPAQQNAAGRQIWHAVAQIPEVFLHQFELRGAIIHLHTNCSMQYILPSEYIVGKYLLCSKTNTFKAGLDTLPRSFRK